MKLDKHVIGYIFLLFCCVGLSFAFELRQTTKAIDRYFDIWQDEIMAASLTNENQALAKKIIKQSEELHPAISVLAADEMQVLQSCPLQVEKNLSFYNLSSKQIIYCRNPFQILAASLISPLLLILFIMISILMFWLRRRAYIDEIAAVKTREKLIAAEYLSEMSKQVAHDIRGPLSAIEAVLQQAKLPVLERSLLEQASHRVFNIARELLNQSSDKNFIYKNDLVAVDPNKVIQEMQNEFSLRFSQLKIEFSLQSQGQFMCSVSGLQRVISNLVQNAVEACSKENAQITISTRQWGGQIVLQVHDNGVGMSAAHTEAIGKKSFSTKTEGHGLGLLDVYKKVSSWQGQVRVLSQAGQGTQIELIFSLVQ
jgi:signal transduction histidine kinase